MQKLLYLSGAFLLVAVADLDYGVYIFLRIFVTFVAALYLFVKVDNLETGLTYLNIGFIVIFLLFNPIIRVPLEKEIWQALDIIAACLFIFAGYRDKRKTSNL